MIIQSVNQKARNMKSDNKLTLNGVDYVKASSIGATPTVKQIVVLDRGWIVVGDISKKGDYLNVKTDDKDVFVTITGYYIPVTE